MLTTQDYTKILTDHLCRIQQDFGVMSMTIFGSVARGDNHSGSDVDILVDMPPKILLMSELKEFLEQILHTSVDLIRRHAHISPQFLNEIKRDAITIL